MTLLERFTRPGEQVRGLRAAWDHLARLPGGRRAFSRLIGAAAPYTGSIRAEVVEASEGRALVKLRERRRVQNHLRSIHAAALANLAEMTGSLAVAFSLPPASRFIPVGLRIDYLKKARGTIHAACTCPAFQGGVRSEHELPIELTNEKGDTVARAHLRVLIGPVAG
jgi:uncharacterized protein (TIGR00369 family)